MRISDWSSDVCSSDLGAADDGPDRQVRIPLVGGRDDDRIGRVVDVHAIDVVGQVAAVGRFAALVSYVPAPILAADVDRAFEADDEFGVGAALANLGAAQIAETLAERERSPDRKAVVE